MIFNRKTFAAMLISASFLAACSGNGGKSAAEQNVNPKAEVKTEVEGAMTPKQISDNGENLVDKEVIISGKVSHVCMRSGKKLFVYANDDTTKLMQVFTGGEIDTFPRELMYKQVAISGILKVKKIEKEKILAQEQQAKEKMPEDTSSQENCQIIEQCHHVMQQAADMKNWMETNNKDYYPVYYIEGRKFLN